MSRPGAFKKGEKKPKQGKRGPCKTTLAAKEAIALAAEKLGGAQGLAKWAKKSPENESLFWTRIYPRLLPVQVTGEGGGPVELIISSVDAQI